MNIKIIGNFLGSGLNFQRALQTDVNWRVDVFIDQRGCNLSKPLKNDSPPKNIKFYNISNNRLVNFISNTFTLFCFIKGDIVLSLTGSLLNSRLWEKYFCFFRLKKYIACASGSDIRELAVSNTDAGRRILNYFKSAHKVFLLNVDMIMVAQKLGLKNYMFFPFAIDIDFYKPNNIVSNREKILFFMPSNLDWGVTDNKSDRNSTKGNDRFLKAFAKAVNQGIKLELILLDRGPDRHLAKEIVKKYSMENHVQFMQEASKLQLKELYHKADVVVDQFDIGSFGTIGLEAMSCGKPVMIYINNTLANICYEGDLPPVVNVSNETEIFEAIVDLVSTSGKIDAIGMQARTWIENNHSFSKVYKKFNDVIRAY